MSQNQYLHTKPHGRLKPQPDAVNTIVVSSGVTSSGLTLTSVEYEQVLSGGIALSNTIDSGGQVTVAAGGRTTSDAITSGGSEIVALGGTAVGAVVSAGGVISGAGLIDGAEVFGFAAGLRVGPTNDFLGFGYVSSGGTASALTVVADGELIVVSSGSAAATVVRGGGLLDVEHGGLVSGSVILAGGALDVEGEADDTRISSGSFGSLEAAGSSSTALLNSATILGGGALVVGSGGVGSFTNITGGAVQLDSGAVLSSATMRGGTLVADPGSLISGLAIYSGGVATIEDSSIASSVSVVSGTLSVGAFGETVGLTVSSGGVFIDNGLVRVGTQFGQPSHVGLAGQITGSGLLIEEGSGTVDVTGATSAFTGELVIAGGRVELATAAGAGGGSIAFDSFITSASTLQIDAANKPATGATYGATLIDFNNSSEHLDLVGVAFTSGATAKAAKNVLTLNDGAYTAKFTLASSRAQYYVAASDGNGGTLIRASTAGSVMPLAQAAASFSAPGPALASLATLGHHGDDVSAALSRPAPVSPAKG